MIKTYHLVIIGDTPIGRYAAFRAIDLKLRVALVEQPYKGRIDGIEEIFRQRWSQLSRFARQGAILQQGDLIDQWPQFKPFALKNLADEYFSQNYLSLNQLNERGCDIIQESGSFAQKKDLYFLTNTRKLQASAYLIATGSSYSQPMIQGLEEVEYMDYLNAPHKLNYLTEKIAIIAETSLGIELAQALNRLGKKVTLIIEDERLLPQEEKEMTRYLQAQLEAEGIELFVDAPVTHVRVIEGQKWIQIGNHAIATHEIMITSHPQANLEGLNLEQMGVKIHKNGINVNQKRQTNHQKIYAVGSVNGNLADFHVAQTEVDIFLKNLIGLSIFSFSHALASSVILTDPTLAKIGLTETKARQIYGDKIIVMNCHDNDLSLLSEMRGKIKIITLKNGQILGAHILGYNAAEYIAAIALAMQQKIPLHQLYQSGFISNSFSAILAKAALQWRQKRLKHYAKWPKFIQAWFI